MPKVSFAVPCVVKDLELLKLCIYSLFSLFENNDIDDIYIIVPSRETHLFQNIFSYYKQVIILDENNVFSSNTQSGWHKQQMLKLYISNIIKSEYYIVLDADCFLTKRINISDIIIDNRPIISLMHKHKNNWLIKSCNYFNLDYNKIPDPVLNVTPQILKTSIVKELIINHDVHSLINSGCNEYWLYFCYLLTKYSFNEVYNLGDNKCHCLECSNYNYVSKLPYPLYNKGIWVKNCMKNKSIEEVINDMFIDDSVIFTLIQSNMGLPNTYLQFIYNNIDNLKCEK